MIGVDEVVTDVPTLRKHSVDVSEDMIKCKDIEVLIERIVITMKNLGKVRGHQPKAMSAIQIGKPYRLCVIRSNFGHYTPIINPVITEKIATTQVNYEMCVSFLDRWFEVLRYNCIKVSYLDAKGKAHHKTFVGQPARILQHEIDHMNGVVPSVKQFKRGEEYVENQKNNSKGKKRA